MKNIQLLFLIIFLAIISFYTTKASINKTINSQTISPARFLIRFPELGEQFYEKEKITIPNSSITKIDVLIPKPISDKVGYGDLFVFLNGQAANRILNKINAQEGKLLRLDLKYRPGFLLQDGNNSIEVLIGQEVEKESYASCIISAPHNLEQVNNTNNTVEKFTGEKYALIIGISQYKYIQSLRYADADARSFRDFLLTPSGGKFKNENIKLLENNDATVTNINKAIEEIKSKITPNDLLVFYLAGHGGPDPNEQKSRYFFTTEFNPSNFKTGLSMTVLRDQLTKEINVKRLVSFIDTCHSAGFGGEDQNKIGMRGVGVNLINQDFTSLLYNAQGIAVLTSSDVNEVSYEDSRWDNHGVFTYYLLKGLKGAADSNSDRVVTAGELFEYTRTEVPKEVSEFLKEVAGNNSQSYTVQHPRAAVGNNNNLELAIVIKDKDK